MPIIVADMELDFKDLTRTALRGLNFEKSAAGFFQHYCFFRSDEIVDFESLALVRTEPSIVF